MRLPLRVLVVAGVVTLVVVGGGVLALGTSGTSGTGGSGDDPAPRVAAFHTTPLAGYDTTTASVARAPFCDRIDDRQVEAVLGQAPEPTTWQSGDQVDVAGSGQTDVVHEFGCSYAVAGVGTAQAWVFAPPMDAERAARLVTSAGKAAGCQAGPGPAYGSPTLALVCAAPDGTVRASYRGLFGDAWLVCELDLPAGTSLDVADVTGRWCVGVLQAAAPAASG